MHGRKFRLRTVKSRPRIIFSLLILEWMETLEDKTCSVPEEEKVEKMMIMIMMMVVKMMSICEASIG